MAKTGTQAGLVYVLIGPSGVGKNTMMRAALAHYKDLKQLPTATTREKRNDEEEGREHFFFDRPGFDRLIEEKALLEWQVIHDNLYGIMRETIETAIRVEDDMIADIDVLGANILQETYPENAVLIFVTPPDIKALEERIRARGEADEAEIARRLQRAAYEMQFANASDYLIINTDLEDATQELLNIIAAERNRRHLRHMTVAVVVYQGERTLVKAGVAPDSLAALPHAPLHRGESPHDAALRLVKSMGFTTAKLIRQPDAPTDEVTPVHFNMDESSGVSQLNLIYACEVDTIDEKPSSDWAWQPIERVPLAAKGSLLRS